MIVTIRLCFLVSIILTGVLGIILDLLTGIYSWMISIPSGLVFFIVMLLICLLI